MVRKFLYLVALAMVATLAFASVAMAQSQYLTGSTGDECSDLEEEFSAEAGSEESPLGGFEETLIFVPDAGGCIDAGGAGAYGPLVNSLNDVVFDPDTGERLGIVKDLDPDLSDGTNSVTYQEFCEDFSETSTPVTAQEYFEQDTNAKEREILDPDGDGQACTSEDAAFLTGDTDSADGGDTGGSAGDSGMDGQQPGDSDDFTGPCAGLAEEVEGPLVASYNYVPEVNGCFAVNGAAASPVGVANTAVFDADTGGELGILKELVDLQQDVEVYDYTTENYCGSFPAPTPPLGTEESPGGNPIISAQEYLDGEAGTVAPNAQEREILDPDGDGLACTAEDLEFAASDGTTNGGQQDQYEPNNGQQDQYDDETDGGDSNEDGGQQDDEIPMLPDTGGPALLLAVAGLLVGSGLLGLFVAIRRRA